ncbi:hypothetical protein SF1_38680 [Sphingobacterium faecium NBRC 15299]|uniref:hypothetical protein n=1 Tax=Sphingobacterium faecium TaxID=34087 RepID=UPI000D497436|nr:hypothetical protein [Sphingobacterium faecium]PTX07565.1 hypothetical protein C8N37_11174 [Sphingobacterium faecium]GEM65886.1 hypothetical protein SF1_38680 [Sphingobacterium faecium NBRC 15299]
MMRLYEIFRDWGKDIGIGYVHDPKINDTYSSTEYQEKDDLDKIKEHRDFLLRLEDQEEKRLESIENKTSTLIAQTAIVFSILGLFLPFIIDKMSSIHLIIKFLITFCLLSCCFFYILTIINAIKNYSINDFKYVRPSANNVLIFKEKQADFVSEEVRDLLFAIPRNRHINNEKGTNLLHSYNSFKYANILSGILILACCIVLFTNSDKGEKSEINIKIVSSDSFFSIKTNELKMDTLIIGSHYYDWKRQNRSK